MFDSILEAVRKGTPTHHDKKYSTGNNRDEKDGNEISKDANTTKVNGKEIEDENQKIKILVIGVGGGGSNCVTRLEKSGIRSAKTVAVNTDYKHLMHVTQAKTKLLIGKSLTRGLGSGGNPEIGKAAADADEKRIREIVAGNSIVFVIMGAGGGTGSGASPVIARIAKEEGAVVIGIATYPFIMERGRLKVAQKAIAELNEYSDSVIVIDNNRLTSFAQNLKLSEAFELVDSVAGHAIRGISDTIMFPSLLNVDYADVKSVMSGGGIAMISLGEGSGPTMVEDAVLTALRHPLLDVSYEGAKGALVHIEGTPGLSLGDSIKIAEGITEKFDPDAEVKFGARINPDMKEGVKVTAIVTGVKSPYILTKEKMKNADNASFDMEKIK